jgi:hypothetical protein
MRNFKNYEVWKKAHQLVLYIYKDILHQLPPEEKYEISKQLRRAAYSVPLNISEGCGRSSEKDFSHCKKLIIEVTEVKAMLIGLIKSIKKQ